ncbi:MAG: acylphosphatase, partial [Parcubacteria group bacterium QH_9_35_7]
MEKHYKIIISGRVQGVFYRKNTKQKAQKLGLTGYVKNMPDGTVKIEVEGEEEKLEKLTEWCHQGSPAANVS